MMSAMKYNNRMGEAFWGRERPDDPLGKKG